MRKGRIEPPRPRRDCEHARATATRALAGVAASLCLCLVVLAGAASVSDLAGQTARAALEKWESQRRVASREEWQKAYDRLLLAHRLNPLSADHSANLGHLLQWRAWQSAASAEDHARARALAHRWYLAAIARRPTWAYAWAHLAENRLLQGRRDEIYLTALGQAAALGPWEPRVQIKVVWMGMATWADLSPETRKIVHESVRRTLAQEQHTDEVIRLAMQYGWLDRLLPMIDTPRQHEVLDLVRSRAAAR